MDSTPQQRKKVCIVGAGIAGVITTLFLSERHPDWDITVIDREKEAGRETSFGPAALTLFFNPPMPIGAPRGAMYFHWKTFVSPRFIRFWTKGLWHSLTDRNSSAKRRQLLRENYDMFIAVTRKYQSVRPYCQRQGAFYVCTSRRYFNRMKRQLDPELYQFLTYEETIAREPALKGERFHGSVFSDRDGFIYCYQFIQEIVRICSERGVRFVFEKEVNGVNVSNTGVELTLKNSTNNNVDEEKKGLDDNERIFADHLIFTAGNDTVNLMNLAAPRENIQYSLFPVKGYTLTGKPKEASGETTPSHAIVFKEKIRFVRPMWDDPNTTADDFFYRIGGLTDFYTDQNFTVCPSRVRQFVTTEFGRKLYETDEKQIWVGNRPQTYNSNPIVRSCANGRIFINTGYGANGYALCWKASDDCITLLEKTIQL